MNGYRRIIRSMLSSHMLLNLADYQTLASFVCAFKWLMKLVSLSQWRPQRKLVLFTGVRNAGELLLQMRILFATSVEKENRVLHGKKGVVKQNSNQSAVPQYL